MKKAALFVLYTLYSILCAPLAFAQGAVQPGNLKMAEPAGLPQLQELIARFINLIVPLAFIILTIMLVVGGIKFLTSGGDSKALANAGSTVTWALLGILFLIIAWLILLLIKAFTGVDVTQFSLSFPGS